MRQKLHGAKALAQAGEVQGKLAFICDWSPWALREPHIGKPRRKDHGII